MWNDLPRRRLEESGVALALLTRLPLPRLSEAAFDRQGNSAWAWPLAGLAVGIPAVLLGTLALAIGLPVSSAALLFVAIQMALTGAMHEDGLADTVDGLWGGWTPDRRLEIMKDSRTGTYGVLALLVATGLRWSVAATLLPLAPAALLACATLSRAPMAVLMAALPNARGGGLSHQVGAPPSGAAWAGVALATGLGLIAAGWAAMGALAAVAVGAVLLGRIARARIGGQTGDILGASQQISEIVAGLTLIALW